MTARILVVDDVAANVRLLETRLSAEYFDVLTAASGAEALDVLGRTACDIVLLDVMMPGMDGFAVCRRIKADPRTRHIPVVLVTALDQPADRVAGLEAGADDFLTKPVSDVALVTRVRSLVRLKQLTDELRLRAETTLALGLGDGPGADPVHGTDGCILLVEDRRSARERIVAALAPVHRVDVCSKPQDAVFRAAEGDHDLVITSLDLADFDALRLCGQIRSIERTRHLPILMLAAPDDSGRLLRGLDLGANDYLVRPVDRNELLARVATQIRQKRHGDRLRDTVRQSIELALTDGLTGLHNRRYLDSHLRALMPGAAEQGRELSLMLVDIDYFKAVNDTYGHDAGDDILREFARRLRKAVRAVDLCCRYGGEEFAVIMPDADRATALAIAERVRQRIAALPFPVAGRTGEVPVTISVGLATRQAAGDAPDALLRRCDGALYAAKRDGRNRVVAEAA